MCRACVSYRALLVLRARLVETTFSTVLRSCSTEREPVCELTLIRLRLCHSRFRACACFAHVQDHFYCESDQVAEHDFNACIKLCTWVYESLRAGDFACVGVCVRGSVSGVNPNVTVTSWFFRGKRAQSILIKSSTFYEKGQWSLEIYSWTLIEIFLSVMMTSIAK